MVQWETTLTGLLPLEIAFVSCLRTPRYNLSLLRLWLWGAIGCTLISSQVLPLRAEDNSENSAEAATAEQIELWITQLDDNHYAIRERAQSHLEEVGGAALDGVAQMAVTGSLESSTRALNILLAWSEGSDPELRIAALEKVAALPHRPTESELAGEVLTDAREAAALAKIAELGGRYTGDVQGTVLINNPRALSLRPIQVIIDAHWKGGVEGLSYLKKIPRAKVLSFHSAPLGDEIVPVLLELPQVTRIELYGTKLSTEALKKLKEKLSTVVDLDVRSGALLGIRNNPLQMVVPGSAADKAGLKPQDLITEIDGEPVKDYRFLIDRIATHQPGDTVTLKVVRIEGKPRKPKQLDIKVTFDRWGKEDPPDSKDPATQQTQVIVPNRISFDRR